MQHSILPSFLHWSARLLGTLLIVLMVGIMFGEDRITVQQMTSSEQLTFCGLGLAVFGLVLGWKWELLGGCTALLGTLAVILLLYFAQGKVLWFVLILALPSLLYIAKGVISRKSS